jgi:hypothetical protein
VEFLRTAVEVNLRVAGDRKSCRDLLTAVGFESVFTVGLCCAFGNVEYAKHIIHKQIKSMKEKNEDRRLKAFVRFVLDDSIKKAAAKESFYFRAEQEFNRAVESELDCSFDYCKALNNFTAQHKRINVVESLFNVVNQNRDTAFYIELLQDK